MQVTETLAEGLKREYQVVLPLAELDARASERLSAIKDRVRLDGFRPGKVPLPHLKRVYGRAVMGEVIEQAISEVNSKIVSDGGFRLAIEPRITLASKGEEAVNKVMEGQGDLAYTVALELLPKIELADFKSIKLERPVAETTEAEVDEAVAKIAEANRPFADKDGKAEKGDRIVVSFRGTIDGKTFEGGSAEEVPIVIGAGQFIPGFEEQLVGIEKGETRTLKVTFPKNYLAEHLAGKEAQFEVTVKNLAGPTAIAINDVFAKTLGLDSLAKLKLQVRERIERGNAAVSRAKLKRGLLDALDERHKFEVPPSLVEQEFNGIWQTVTKEMETQGGSFADEDTTEAEARAEYRQIAERRVRLGLVLAEVGEKNSITVSDDELTRAALERARQYRGQEQQAFEQIRRDPAMMATLRAPVFEEKVVDFLLELASVTNKPVSREQLFSDEEHYGEDSDSQKDKGKKSRKSAKVGKASKG
ncbi:MAG: trigger factor [Xanthobacteraceae bacterium]|nr:trigger factor [Xanthobacteraceae bacterium]